MAVQAAAANFGCAGMKAVAHVAGQAAAVLAEALAPAASGHLEELRSLLQVGRQVFMTYVQYTPLHAVPFALGTTHLLCFSSITKLEGGPHATWLAPHQHAATWFAPHQHAADGADSS